RRGPERLLPGQRVPGGHGAGALPPRAHPPTAGTVRQEVRMARELARRAPLLCVVAALGLLPRWTDNRAILTWAFLVLLYAALAQSWNLLGGFGGQVNLGHAAFFGLGALVTRRLWLGGLPFGAALLLGTLASAGMGVLVGVPSLRLRGPYFAIGTLAVAEILRITVGNALPQVSVLPAQALATY